jgi:hypothetical protein
MWPFKKKPPQPPGKWDITSKEAIEKYGSAVNALHEWHKDGAHQRFRLYAPYDLSLKATVEIIDILKKDGKI